MGNPPLYPPPAAGKPSVEGRGREGGREGNDADGALGQSALPRLATWNVVKNCGRANDEAARDGRYYKQTGCASDPVHDTRAGSARYTKGEEYRKLIL